MVQPAGKKSFLTLEHTFNFVYFDQSPLKIQFNRGICRQRFLAESAIQLFPNLFLYSSSSPCLLATSSSKFVKDNFYSSFQIFKLQALECEVTVSSVEEPSLPNSMSVRSPSRGITALKQSTKEAQIKGMKQVKQEIWYLVFGVMSPQPIVVAVTMSLQKMMQSSGTVPSGSLSVQSLYPSSTSPKNKYYTKVYLSRLINILSNLVILFLAVANKSQTTSPRILDTYMILKKNSPTRKLQLLGIRLQVRKSEMTSCKTSKKCFLETNKESNVKPIYIRTV